MAKIADLSLALALPVGSTAVAKELPKLEVSNNGRFLVTETGQPFFWLGDTCWMLFQHGAKDKTPHQPAIDVYFKDRASKRFNVVQTTFLFFPDQGNIYGHEPFIDGDFSRPKIVEGEWNDFWDVADYMIDRAQQHGLYLALLPVWNTNLPVGHAMDADPGIAYGYGNFVGKRYGKRTHIIWVMGGDPHRKGTDVDNPARLRLNRALAEGVADGVNGVEGFDGKADYSKTLMTYHPRGGSHSSSEHLHKEPWLDFHMIQTGPGSGKYHATYAPVERDYALEPPKPTLVAEPVYENAYKTDVSERYDAFDVRQAAYSGVFAGGFGHTYGALEIWQLLNPGILPLNKKVVTGNWYELLDLPGAASLQHMRSLMESRPSLKRIPDQSLIEGGNPAGKDHVQATRASDGSYALVYVPTGKPVSVRLEKLSGNQIRVRWYDVRTGRYLPAGDVSKIESHTFRPPAEPAGADWVLVLDSRSGS